MITLSEARAGLATLPAPRTSCRPGDARASHAASSGNSIAGTDRPSMILQEHPHALPPESWRLRNNYRTSPHRLS